MGDTEESVSKLRLLGEIFVVIIAFTAFTVAIGLLFYRMQAGFGEEPIMPTSNVGRDMVALATLFTTPLTLFCTVLIIEFILLARGTDIFSFGLDKPKSWGKTMLVGLGLAFLFTGIWYGFRFFNLEFAQHEPTRYFDLIRGSGLLYFFSMTGVAWFAAGFAEEVIFRGFFLNNFVGIFGENRFGIGLAILLQALFYTGFHATDTLLGMAPIFIIGILMGAAYFLLNRKLWPLIIAHGIVSSVYFTNIYFGPPG